MHIKATFDDGESIEFDAPDTHTVRLRGGGEHVFHRNRYHPAGMNHSLFYGEKRYLKDSAASVAILREFNAKEVKILRGANGVTHDKEANTYHVSASVGVPTLVKAGAVDLVAECNAQLDEFSRVHAIAREEALCTGVIPVGRVASGDPVVALLKTAVINAYCRATGAKKSHAGTALGKLPATRDELRDVALAIPGLSLPESFNDAGSWWDAVVVSKEEEVARVKAASEGLGV